MNKLLNILFIFIASIILFFIFFSSDFKGGAKSATENRYLAKMPEIKELSTSAFEKWINDNIGYRAEMINLRALVEFKLLNKSSSQQVVIGKDGFLFYTGNENIEMALNKYNFTSDDYKNISKNLEILSNMLAKQNIKFIYLMPPGKVSIYPEKIRGYNLSVTDTPVDIIEQHLPDSVNYINIKDYLLANKNKDNIDKLYWKTDTHWTYYGAYLGYLAIIEEMNKLNLFENKIIPTHVTYRDDYRLGDMASMLGGEDIVPKEKYKHTTIENATFVKNDLSKPLLKLQNEKKGSNIYQYSNPSCQNNISVLAIGDSMFGSWNISELFAQTFCKYTFVWNLNFSKELIDEVKPDIIIFDAGERTLKYSVFNKIKDYLGDNAIYKEQSLLSVHKIENDIYSTRLLFNFDINEYKHNVLTLQGWIYDKNDSSTGNVYIRIKDGSGNIKEYKAEMQERVDVAQHFSNNNKLISSGFIVNIPVEDNYEVIDIILEKNDIYYSSPAFKGNNYNGLSKNVNIKDNIISCDNVTFGIDKKEYKNNILTIQGWVYNKSDSSTGNVYIRLKDSSNNIKVYSTQMQERADVVKYFNNKRLLNSGFQADIEVDSDYEILDIIIENKGKYYSKLIEK